MSDFSGTLHPWEENYSQGRYLAGIEAVEGTLPPEGWTKWTVPAQEYFTVEVTGPKTFRQALKRIKAQGCRLAGAVHDFTCPKTGKDYLFLPINEGDRNLLGAGTEIAAPVDRTALY